MEDKINTQGMSGSVSDNNPFTTNQQRDSPFIPHKLSIFSEMEREEIKQMIVEVITQHQRYDVMDRIRDDYHHGGYDEYK